MNSEINTPCSWLIGRNPPVFMWDDAITVGCRWKAEFPWWHTNQVPEKARSHVPPPLCNKLDSKCCYLFGTATQISIHEMVACLPSPRPYLIKHIFFTVNLRIPSRLFKPQSRLISLPYIRYQPNSFKIGKRTKWGTHGLNRCHTVLCSLLSHSSSTTAYLGRHTSLFVGFSVCTHVSPFHPKQIKKDEGSVRTRKDYITPFVLQFQYFNS